MKTTITARKVNLHPSFTQRAEKKLDKLDKFFDNDAVADVTVSQDGGSQRVEITIRHGGMVFRAENCADEAVEVVDNLVEVLLRQIRRNKTKLEKRLHSGAFMGEMPWDNSDVGELEYRVVRSKKFAVKPMDVEEAILQMNLLGHQFYMFRNMESGDVSVVYSRKNGDYGLLESND